MNRLTQEPVLVMGVVQALLALIISFGIGLTADQVGTVTAASAAVLALVARSKVTPT